MIIRCDNCKAVYVSEPPEHIHETKVTCKVCFELTPFKAPDPDARNEDGKLLVLDIR